MLPLLLVQHLRNQSHHDRHVSLSRSVPLSCSRSKAVGLAATALVAIAPSWGTASTLGVSNDVPVATIRVYDYAQVPAESLRQAQQLVTKIYSAIGVRIRWLDTVRAEEMPLPRGASIADSNGFVMIVRNSSTSSPYEDVKDALGTAVISRHNGGRVAYVMSDRIRRVAGGSETTATSVMGAVIAHELGHLLLPRGSHSPSGLMQANWDRDVVLEIKPTDLKFTPKQARLVREALRRSSGSPNTD